MLLYCRFGLFICCLCLPILLRCLIQIFASLSFHPNMFECTHTHHFHSRQLYHFCTNAKASKFQIRCLVTSQFYWHFIISLSFILLLCLQKFKRFICARACVSHSLCVCALLVGKIGIRKLKRYIKVQNLYRKTCIHSILSFKFRNIVERLRFCMCYQNRLVSRNH